jgi:hypothetical protein
MIFTGEYEFASKVERGPFDGVCTYTLNDGNAPFSTVSCWGDLYCEGEDYRAGPGRPDCIRHIRGHCRAQWRGEEFHEGVVYEDSARD